MGDTHTTDGDESGRPTTATGDESGRPGAEGRTPPPGSHGARAALYGAVGAVLAGPDAETLADLRAGEVRASLREAGERLGLAAETAAFCEAVATADGQGAMRAYDEVFGLPTDDGTYPVVPYEAHYTTGEEGGEAQRRIATVVGLMEAFDVEPAATFHERQDHAAGELELAAVVAAKRAVAREADASAGATEHLRDAEATLLDRHLADFVPAFAHDVRTATDDPLLLATADLAGELVRRDAAGSLEVRDDA